VLSEKAGSAAVVADCPGVPVSWTIRSDLQAILLAEHARDVGDPSMIQAADLLISLVAGRFKRESCDAGTAETVIGKSTSVQKPQRHLVGPGKTAKKT
jgi:hypothetical protein